MRCKRAQMHVYHVVEWSYNARYQNPWRRPEQPSVLPRNYSKMGQYDFSPTASRLSVSPLIVWTSLCRATNGDISGIQIDELVP